jgi:hypothetical protein
MSAALEPQRFFIDAGIAIAFWNNVVLIDASREIGLARLRKLAEAYKTLLARYPHIVALCVLRPGTPVSSPETRVEAANLQRTLGTALAHIALVTEDVGVIAQLLRTMIRGHSRLTRNAQLSIDEDVDAALQRILPQILADDIPREHVGEALKRAFGKVRVEFSRVQNDAVNIRR